MNTDKKIESKRGEALTAVALAFFLSVFIRVIRG
jgi:hypothetical protein